MKKILALLLAALMALALAGCGGNTETPAPHRNARNGSPRSDRSPGVRRACRDRSPRRTGGRRRRGPRGRYDRAGARSRASRYRSSTTPSACRPVRRNMLPAALSPAARTAYCPMTASRCTPSCSPTAPRPSTTSKRTEPFQTKKAGFVPPTLPERQRSLAEFAPAGANKALTIFSGGMCAGDAFGSQTCARRVRCGEPQPLQTKARRQRVLFESGKPLQMLRGYDKMHAIIPTVTGGQIWITTQNAAVI